MRLVRVKTPEGGGEQVAQLAFEAGIPQVSIHQQGVLKPGRKREVKDVIDIETATPTAKAFLDALMSAPFYDSEKYSINVRQPRSIVSREKPRRITWPLVEPGIDIYEKLWQFSHITFGFAGRALLLNVSESASARAGSALD